MTDTGKKLAKAAIILMVTVAISRILGFAREAVMMALFGQNYITDAYRAAFSIPDFIYLILVGGALSAAFIPIFSSYLNTGQENKAWESASIVFNYILLLLIVLISIGYLFTEPLIRVLAPGLPPEYASLAVRLTHIMFIQTFFMALCGISQGILNAYNEFVAPAVGSVLYNLLIIVIGVLFVKQIGIAAFSYGVVIGAVLNFAIQLPALRRVGITYHFSWDYKNPGFVKIMLLMIPVLVSLSVVQINLFVTQNLASSVGEGMISAMNLAQKITNLPIGIFGVAIATAVFPTLTALTATGDMAKFRVTNSLGLRAIFIVAIPAAAGLAALGEPLVKLLFQQGQFTASMSSITFQIMAFFCIGIFAYSGIQLLNRSFYALQDTISPLLTGVLTIGLNIVLSLALVHPLGVRGLALASSLAGVFNLAALLLILRWKSGPLGGRKLVVSLSISTLASAVMFAVVYYSCSYLMTALTLTAKLNQLVSVAAGVSLGVVVYGLIVYSFKLEESELVLDMIRKRFPKRA